MYECCIVGCETRGTRGGGESNPRCLFKIKPGFPQHDKVLSLIKHYMKPERRRKQYVICDLHYDKSCVLTSGTKIWKDGKETYLPRQKLRLRKDSIPTIFAPATVDLSRKLTQRFDKITNYALESSNTSFLASIFEKYENIEKKDGPFTRQKLMENWKTLIQKEEALARWGLCDTSSYAAFIYFGDGDQTGSKTILIRNDMSFEVRYKGSLAKLTECLEKIESFQQFLGQLIKVTCSRVCEGIEGQPDIVCENILFIPKLKSSSNKCAGCQKKNRQLKLNKYRRESRAKWKEARMKKDREKLTLKRKRAVKKAAAISEIIEDLKKKVFKP